VARRRRIRASAEAVDRSVTAGVTDETAVDVTAPIGGAAARVTACAGAERTRPRPIVIEAAVTTPTHRPDRPVKEIMEEVSVMATPAFSDRRRNAGKSLPGTTIGHRE